MWTNILSTLILSHSTTNGETMEPKRRLPQHRITRPHRTVPYPENHPLGRHLRNTVNDAIDDIDGDYIAEDEDGYIIGGDGWSNLPKQLQVQRAKTRRAASETTNNNKKNRPNRNLQISEPEKVLEPTTHNKYWTVTGRNLVNEIATNEGEGSLLVDARDMGENGWGGEHEVLIEAENVGAVDRSEVFQEEIVNGTKDEMASSVNSTPAETTTEAKSAYQPIRLRAILTDDESSGSKYLTLHQRKMLMEDMINPALYGWSKALHVVPVGGNLVVDRGQLFDGVSCGPGLDSGLPSVKVPKEHLTTGLQDTDTVIYISVAFTNKATPIFTRTYLHGGQDGPIYHGSTRKRDVLTDELDVDVVNQTEVPSQSPSDSPTFAPSETEPYIESRPLCPGTYLASATYCSTDQFDRPVAGLLSLCINDIQTFFHKSAIKRNIVTIMHEMGHVLGFNAESLAHFRNGRGEPLTPRDSSGNVPLSKVECTGVHPRREAEISLPSPNVTVFKNVRGGVRVATIVTPTVRRVVRNMFGCQSLGGAELESGEYQLFDDSDEISAGECIGDHWERRLFRTDLLNPIVDDVAYSLYVSSLTLAYFADSGWYRVDTRRIAPSSIWGRNAGCNFVNLKCVTGHGSISASNNAFFCNNFISPEPETSAKKSNTKLDTEPTMEIHGCDLGSSSKAVCSIVEYDIELPVEYNYFGKTKLIGGDLLGGSDPTLDYCPVFQAYSNGKCDSDSAEKYVGVKKSLEVFGESNSRCVIGNVDRKRTALCLPMACVIQDQTLMVKVDGYWKSCLYAGQIISVWWNRKDYVVCPDPSHLCPTFYCKNDCFKEGGVCDYHSGQCMCTPLAKTNSTTPSSWISTYYSTPILEPCSVTQLHSQPNGSYHIAERIDVELPEYYVTNTTFLLDDPRDFDDKVSRMFAQLSSGEVVGLVASFMLFVMFSYLIWHQLVRCYKERLLGSSLSRVKSSVNSLSGLLRNTSLASLNRQGTDDDDDNDSNLPPNNRRPGPGGQNPQKDKMVATLLVHNRIESTALAQRMEQQARLELAGMGTNSQFDQTTQTVMISAAEELTLVNRSELPPLPDGGRVLAVIGAHIVEDAREEQSSVTSATHVTNRSIIPDDDISEYTSPLYHDEDDERQSEAQRYLRLRHGNSIRQFDID